MAKMKRFMAMLMAMLMILQVMPVEAMAEGIEGLKSRVSNVITGSTFFTLTFTVEGADGNDDVITQYVENGQKPVLPENPAKAGYTFVGWFTADDTEVTKETLITSDMAAVARFTPIATVTVTVNYVAEDGTQVADPTVREYLANSEDVITCPAEVVHKGVTLYPEQTSVTVNADLLNKAVDGAVTVTVKYAQADAQYTVKHWALKADYESYEGLTITAENIETYCKLIGSEDKMGASGATVTPNPLTGDAFDHYDFDHAESVVLDKSDKKTVNVFYIPKTYTLTYNTQGGSYVAPKTGKYGSEVEVYTFKAGETTYICGLEEHTHSYNACGWSYRGGWQCGKTAHTHNASCRFTSAAVTTPTPTKTGYVFEGWYIDEDCKVEAKTTMTLTADTTVYAKWTAGTANYTVVYMAENVNDENNPNYITSEVKTGKVGDTATGTAHSGNFATSIFADQAYYEYDSTKSTSAEIKPDGSTVVTSYYKLKTYTMTFKLNNKNATLTIGTESYGKNGKNKGNYSFTAKLGQDVSTLWPTADNISGANNFYGWWNPNNEIYQVSKILVLSKELIGSSTSTGTTFTADYTSGTKVELHYMLQNADDDGYTDMDAYRQSAITTSTDFGQKQIEGYDIERKEYKYVDDVKHYYFYYTRKNFNIEYYNGTDLLQTVNVRYGKAISDSTYAVPTPEELGLADDYTVTGWYTDPEGTSKYTFSTMPNTNLKLYLKVEAPKRTVTFEFEDGQSETKKYEIPLGTKLGEVPTPVREGYEFLGWFTEDGAWFDDDQPIMQDMTVYAHWKMKALSYTVKYVDAAGNAVAPSKTVTNASFQPDQEITERAITVAGMRYDAETKSTTLEIGVTNEIIFVYSPAGKVPTRCTITSMAR